MQDFRKRLLVFFPLAFLLSWYSFLLKLGGLKAANGGINPLGPLVAAMIVSASFDGWTGFKRLFGRYFRRMDALSLATAILLPVGLNAVAAAINVAMGAAMPTATKFAGWREMLPSFVFIFVFIGVGEETGWRGYALPWLQKRYSPLVSSLILGTIWAAWHIPLMGVEFKGQVIAAFLVSIVPAAVILTWLFNHSNENLLTAPLFHAMVNTVGGGFVFRMFEGADLTRLWWIYALLWFAAGATLIVASRQRMLEEPGRECKLTQPVSSESVLVKSNSRHRETLGLDATTVRNDSAQIVGATSGEMTIDDSHV